MLPSLHEVIQHLDRSTISSMTTAFYLFQVFAYNLSQFYSSNFRTSKKLIPFTCIRPFPKVSFSRGIRIARYTNSVWRHEAENWLWADEVRHGLAWVRLTWAIRLSSWVSSQALVNEENTANSSMNPWFTFAWTNVTAQACGIVQHWLQWSTQGAILFGPVGSDLKGNM